MELRETKEHNMHMMRDLMNDTDIESVLDAGAKMTPSKWIGE